MDTILFIPANPIRPPPTEKEMPPEREHGATGQTGNNRPQRTHEFVVTTGNGVEGRTIENYLGIVRGIVVRFPTCTQDFFGGLQQIVGGNIEPYAKVCGEARREAFDRMVAQAKKMSADAIIAMRYDATEFSPGAQEVLAYGTAAKLAEP